MGVKAWDLRSFAMVSLVNIVLITAIIVSADQDIVSKEDVIQTTVEKKEIEDSSTNFLVKLGTSSGSGYQHTWPEIEFGWRIIVGTIIGFLGAAFGTVGGVGGGGIFVTMLSLIIGFDKKSATAISKCMITGGAGATVFYNLKQKHPTLDMPVIDYDLALLFQPVLVLGISIGVVFNVVFADWMITVLLIVVFILISIKAMMRGIETWKKETILMKESARQAELNDIGRTREVAYEALPGGPRINDTHTAQRNERGTLVENINWKALGLLFTVWLSILALEIAKNQTATCSVEYWVFNILQVPVALGVAVSQAVLLYNGKRVIASKGDQQTHWRVHQLVLYCSCGIATGMVGGLLGLGGGFILGPLFLELGIPPQVSSATATFSMTFSASMSVIEYHLLNRFPIPYTLYFVAVSTIAALLGQHVVKKLITVLGRASLIIFILAGIVFVSALSLGSVGIANMVEKIAKNEYMGFEDLCSYAG